MITKEKAFSIIRKEKPNHKITASYEFPDKFAFICIPNDANPDTFITNGIFVMKKDGHIEYGIPTVKEMEHAIKMDEELSHHGVSGMKWGKRNGPPYPLNSEGKASLRKQRMDSYGSSVTKGGGDGSVTTKKKTLSKKSKEDLKVYKQYNKQRAAKAVARDVAIATTAGGAIGTATGGPVAGLASMLASGLATTVVSSAVNAGRNIVANSKYKNMLLESQEVMNAVKNGEAKLSNATPQEIADKNARQAAQKAGLDQGDNWKVYRDAQAGDKKAQQIVKEWESSKKNKKSDDYNSTITKGGVPDSGSSNKSTKKETDYSKMDDTQLSAAKKQVIRDGNVKEAYENRKYYTNEEIKEVQTRYVLNQDLSSLANADKNAGRQKVEEIAAKLETVNRLGRAVAVGAGNVAMIANAIGPFIASANGGKFNQVNKANIAL